MADIIVVGGGMLGVSTAWRLAQAGAQVTLLEANRLGDGATEASFSWVNANNKSPERYHRLNVDGMNEYHRLRSELDNVRWLRTSGHVEWNASQAGQQKLAEKVERLRGWGYTAELLSLQDLRTLEPDLTPPNSIEAVVYYPQEGYIDAVDAVGGLASEAKDAGVVIVEGARVKSLTRETDRITGVTLENGDRLGADVVVSCAGVGTHNLLQTAHVDLEMAPTVGMVAVSRPTTARLTAIHRSHELSIRPDGAGRIMIRHYDFDKLVSIDTTLATAGDVVRQMIERVTRVLPTFAGTALDVMRVRHRPVPGDGKPVVGFAADVEGLYCMLCHSGVTLGPLLGRIATREILHGDRDIRLEPFRPGRDMSRTPGQQELHGYQ